MFLHRVYRGETRISLGTYVRVILAKKNMTQQELVNKINELGLMENDAVFTRQKLSNILNGIIPLSNTNARKIEIALGLPEKSLKRFEVYRR